MHIAYKKILPFIMKYLNLLSSSNDFRPGCFPITPIIRMPENSAEAKHSNIPAIRCFSRNGWNNANFRV